MVAKDFEGFLYFSFFIFHFLFEFYEFKQFLNVKLYSDI